MKVNVSASNKQGLKEVRSTETGWVSDSKRRQISPFPAFRSFTVIRIETDEHGRCICMRDQRNDGCAERTSLPLSLSYCVQLLLVDVSDSLDLKDCQLVHSRLSTRAVRYYSFRKSLFLKLFFKTFIKFIEKNLRFMVSN